MPPAEKAGGLLFAPSRFNEPSVGFNGIQNLTYYSTSPLRVNAAQSMELNIVFVS
jgi:hypothetical protein